MTPSIETLTTAPIIGKYYLVPTVRYNCCGMVSDWPVFGPKHDDAEIIGFPWPHYHHDSRFMSKVQYDQVTTYAWRRPPNVNIAAIPLSKIRDDVIAGARERKDPADNEPHPAPVYKRLRCKREMHRFPTKDDLDGSSYWPADLRKAYRDDCLRVTESGTFCPHRGVRMDTLKAVDGVITCPLHGLRFWVATGKALWKTAG